MKLDTDEEITDETPIDMMNVPEGFEDAWRVWKEQVGDPNKELSYKALRSFIMKVD